MLSSTTFNSRFNLWVLIGALLLALGCAGGTQSASGTPTTVPVPTPTIEVIRLPTAPPADTQTGVQLEIAENKGTVRIAEWDDNRTQLLNAIVGYILVWGYNYHVEMIEGGPLDYQSALFEDRVEVVLQADAEWAESNTGSLIDLGTLALSDTNSRVVAGPELEDWAEEVVDFLGNFKPDPEQVDSISSMISTSRVGINTISAALIYFKNNRDDWTSWVPEDIVANVDAAVLDGKITLLDLPCGPNGRDALRRRCS